MKRLALFALLALGLTGCIHAGVPARTGRVPTDGSWRLGLTLSFPGMATGPGRHCPRDPYPPRDLKPPSAGQAQTPTRPTPLVHRPPPQSEWASTRTGCGIRSTARSTYVIIFMMLPPSLLLSMANLEVGYTSGRTETIAHLSINQLGAEVRHAAVESAKDALAVEGGVFWRPGHRIPHSRLGFTRSLGETAGFTGGAHLSFGPEPHAPIFGFKNGEQGAPLTLRLTGVIAGHGRPEGLELVGGIAPYVDLGIKSRQLDFGGHPLLHLGTGALLAND